MLRILMVGAAIAAALVFAQREHWIARAGFVGTCRLAPVPIGDTAQWWTCRQGLLTGYPVLTRHECVDQGIVLGRELWRCPTPLETAPGGVF
jgi:hypothetical protein